MLKSCMELGVCKKPRLLVMFVVVWGYSLPSKQELHKPLGSASR